MERKKNSFRCVCEVTEILIICSKEKKKKFLCFLRLEEVIPAHLLFFTAGRTGYSQLMVPPDRLQSREDPCGARSSVCWFVKSQTGSQGPRLRDGQQTHKSYLLPAATKGSLAFHRSSSCSLRFAYFIFSSVLLEMYFEKYILVIEK